LAFICLWKAIYPIKQQYHGDAIVLPIGFRDGQIIIAPTPLGTDFYPMAL
jgi:hypothetical protein